MNFSTIWVDSETEYAKIVDFLQISQPALAARVKLYLKDTPIFEEFGVQEEINNSLKSKVWLKSGGYIVINQTEALVAIDVNTGKYVGKTQRLEDTIVKTNVDAIKEIVRQVRLRDLGGIIVIDFIDMDERRNRQKVMQALEEALRQDRAPSKALAFNDFGLVAITRKRVKQPLERALGCVCPYCTGSGFVKSAQTVSLEILAESKKVLPSIERGTVTLRVNPEVGKYLKQTNPAILREMEEMGRKSIVVKNDISLHQENFDFH
jgi:ribonuclease G